MALVLASKSPRRRELMRLVTPLFEVDEADVDERGISADNPAALSLAIALAKAGDVAARRPRDIIIGCDTVVEVDGATLGKPRDEAQAVEMLTTLSGRRHLVHTGVGIYLSESANSAVSFINTTAVDFAPIPAAEIAAYAKTPEPYDKAGGYGIQSWAARYITGVEGCFFNVMGLPVAELYAQLVALGLVFSE